MVIERAAGGFVPGVAVVLAKFYAGDCEHAKGFGATAFSRGVEQVEVFPGIGVSIVVGEREDRVTGTVIEVHNLMGGELSVERLRGVGVEVGFEAARCVPIHIFVCVGHEFCLHRCFSHDLVGADADCCGAFFDGLTAVEGYAHSVQTFVIESQLCCVNARLGCRCKVKSSGCAEVIH